MSRNREIFWDLKQQKDQNKNKNTAWKKHMQERERGEGVKGMKVRTHQEEEELTRRQVQKKTLTKTINITRQVNF